MKLFKRNEMQGKKKEDRTVHLQTSKLQKKKKKI